jgi:hypothetical protein
MGVDREEGDGVYMCSATKFARSITLLRIVYIASHRTHCSASYTLLPGY